MYIYNVGWYALLIVFYKIGEKYFFVKYIYRLGGMRKKIL